VNYQTDNLHCGNCQHQCNTLFETCTAGTCACQGGTANCNGNCVDKATDPNQCGACGVQCGPRQYCSNGECVCRPGFELCNGVCVDTNTSPAACGACGTACTQQNPNCDGGTCKTSCTAGLTSCAQQNRVACVNTQTDPTHCGGCGTTCARDEICAGGTCRPYASALPCTTCPCANVCADLIGNQATCCGGYGLNTDPICLEGSNVTCP
jgi:hypothetical protein